MKVQRKNIRIKLQRNKDFNKHFKLPSLESRELGDFKMMLPIRNGISTLEKYSSQSLCI